MKKGYTDLTIIMDRSSSMSGIARDMEDGLAHFFGEQRRHEGECRVTVVKFDDQYEIEFANVLVENIYSRVRLEPRGWTALYDAIGRTVTETAQRLSKLSEADQPEKVLVMILTDGQENSSKRWTKLDTRNLVEYHRKNLKWEFMFLGSNQDSILSATELGVDKTNAYNFANTTKSSDLVWRATSKGVAEYRSGNEKQVSNVLNVGVNDLIGESSETPKGWVASATSNVPPISAAPAPKRSRAKKATS